MFYNTENSDVKTLLDEYFREESFFKVLPKTDPKVCFNLFKYFCHNDTSFIEVLQNSGMSSRKGERKNNLTDFSYTTRKHYQCALLRSLINIDLPRMSGVVEIGRTASLAILVSYTEQKYQSLQLHNVVFYPLELLPANLDKLLVADEVVKLLLSPSLKGVTSRARGRRKTLNRLDKSGYIVTWRTVLPAVSYVWDLCKRAFEDKYNTPEIANQSNRYHRAMSFWLSEFQWRINYRDELLLSLFEGAIAAGKQNAATKSILEGIDFVLSETLM